MSTTTRGPVGSGTDLLVPFPDPPPRHPDEMSSFRHLSNTGSAHYLGMHFRNPTTLVGGELYIAPEPGQGTRGLRVPDLLGPVHTTRRASTMRANWMKPQYITSSLSKRV